MHADTGEWGNTLIQVNAAPVIRAARYLETQGDGTSKKIKMDDPIAASKAHEGWDASAANNACVTAWRVRLQKLGKAALDASEELTKSMDDYISTDGSVRDDMSKGASWLRGA